MAEMALGYGSEFQLLRYLGHHRNYLNDEIMKVIGKGPIEWLDYPINLNRDSRDGELCGIGCFKNLPNFNTIKEKWEKYWPQSGNAHNWDGIFIQNETWYFVEAKAHIEEANQKCTATSPKSIETIIQAFEDTCGNRLLAEQWQKSNCYQLANRLAFINFCEKVGIKAKLLYVSFINGYEISTKKNVLNSEVWEEKWKEEINQLQLKKADKLISNIFKVYIDCHKPEDLYQLPINK